MHKPLVTLLTLLSLTLLPACQNTPKKNQYSASGITKNNKACGVTRGSFLGSWFDYYERGLSFADCGLWQASEQDLKKALSKRSRDQRRAYSLGMHLISDYFPHRELGIALFHQKNIHKQKKNYTPHSPNSPLPKPKST